MQGTTHRASASASDASSVIVCFVNMAVVASIASVVVVHTQWRVYR